MGEGHIWMHFYETISHSPTCLKSHQLQTGQGHLQFCLLEVAHYQFMTGSSVTVAVYVKALSTGNDRSEQTVQAQIRLLLRAV